MKNKKNMILHCLSYKSNDKIVSVCIDLDLFSEADTFRRSKEKLIDAILLYVQSARENNKIGKLIPRRAPLKYRILYRNALICNYISTINRWLRQKLLENYGFRPFDYEYDMNYCQQN